MRCSTPWFSRKRSGQFGLIAAAAAAGVVWIGASIGTRTPADAAPPAAGAPATPPVPGLGDEKPDFQAVMAKMKAAKPAVMKKHMDLLTERYDLGDHPSKEKMSRGKAVQEGVRVKLAAGTSWDS